MYLIFRRWRWSQFPMITIVLWNQRDGARAIFESGVHERRRVIVVHQWLEVKRFSVFQFALRIGSSVSACIIARHRVIGRPGVGGVAGSQGGGLSEGQAGSGRQAAQRTPPPRGPDRHWGPGLIHLARAAGKFFEYIYSLFLIGFLNHLARAAGNFFKYICLFLIGFLNHLARAAGIFF